MHLRRAFQTHCMWSRDHVLFRRVCYAFGRNVYYFVLWVRWLWCCCLHSATHTTIHTYIYAMDPYVYIAASHNTTGYTHAGCLTNGNDRYVHYPHSPFEHLPFRVHTTFYHIKSTIWPDWQSKFKKGSVFSFALIFISIIK